MIDENRSRIYLRSPICFWDLWPLFWLLTTGRIWAAIMVIIAVLTDGLDGKLARALNAQSEFGKELDSLSDVISFGVAPAFIVYVVVFRHLGAIGWAVTACFRICGALAISPL